MGSTYAEAIGYLESFIDYERTGPDGRSPRFFNLERMIVLLRALGDPGAALRAVHIGGTNGKGSVAAMVASVAGAAGLKVGLYTSPHLVDCRERIRLDGEMIREEEFARLAGALPGAVRELEARPELGPVSFFELYTALAFLCFSSCGVDLAVVEVGLGGRLDATNVIKPSVVAITPIGLDHTAELGCTLGAIAGEKAGIIKEGVPVVMGIQPPAAEQVIRRRAGELGAPVIAVSDRPDRGPVAVGAVRESLEGTRFDIEGRRGSYRDLRVPLLGRHQSANAATAVAVVECLQDQGWDLGPDDIRTGLGRVAWPGRLQLIRGEPDILVDGGHNPGAVRALGGLLRRLAGGRRVVMVFGANRDKDLAAVGKEIAALAPELVLTRSRNERSADPGELEQRIGAGAAAARAAATVPGAVRLALEIARPRDLVCVAGSFYVAGEALKELEALGRLH